MPTRLVTTSEKIVLDFAWKGPNAWPGGSLGGGQEVAEVGLAFKDAITDIRVHLPGNINSLTPQKFSFTCLRHGEKTCPAQLRVTAEQVRDLALKAGLFDKTPIVPTVINSFVSVTEYDLFLKANIPIELDVPEELELGQTYSLVVASDSSDYPSLSACLVKEKQN